MSNRNNNNRNNNNSNRQGGHPRQRRDAEPVEVEGAQPATSRQNQSRSQNANANTNKSASNNNNSNRNSRPTGLQASLGNPIPRGNAEAFKPTDLTTTGSIEKNDPLLLDAVLVDGACGAVACAREREFQLDFSQYIQIIKSSYHVMTRLDRSLQKYVSFSTYQYYCVVLLWKRLLFVQTERGEGVNEYEAFKRSLPPMAIPDEIGYYLDGVGNVTDYNSRKYNLALQAQLSITQIEGISGHYSRVDGATHIMYETLPSPFVAVYRILQDLALTQSQHRLNPIDYSSDWDLPSDLRPTGTSLPNENLLGWGKATPLTAEQLSMVTNAGLDATFTDQRLVVFNTDGITNRYGMPIIYHMLLQTSELLSGSKSAFNNHAESTSYKGSMAQIGFSVRAFLPKLKRPKAISESEATAHFYTQVSVHMCGAASTFRYRVKRVVPGLHDSLCYLSNTGQAPQSWANNADAVFEFTDTWNQEEFRTILVSGLSTCDKYSERIRKILPKDQV